MEQELWDGIKRAQEIVESEGFRFSDEQLFRLLEEYKASDFEKELDQIVKKSKEQGRNLAEAINEHFNLGVKLCDEY